MTIQNGRTLEERPKLEIHGFEFVDHDTKVKNFFDAEELKSVYYPEVEKLVRERTGASRVAVATGLCTTVRGVFRAGGEETVGRGGGGASEPRR